MPLRRSYTRGRRRPRRNWQWARVTSNDVTQITAPGHYNEDLLSSFKAVYGFSANFPDITIWRVRIKISVGINFVAAPVNFETAGVVCGFFVEDMAFTLQGVETQPYMERFMWYETVYYQEMVAQGAPQLSANANQWIVKSFDLKSRRRLSNVNDTLVMQVGTTGQPVNKMIGLSWNGSILLSLGRR